MVASQCLRFRFGALFALLGIGLAAGCSRGAPENSGEAVERPAARANDFVGSQVCAECHLEIATAYAQHPMGRSMAIVGVHENSGRVTGVTTEGDRQLGRLELESSIVEDYSAGVLFDKGRGRRYQIERRDGGVWHHEIGFDRSGTVLFDQDVPISLAIGSGKRGRSYVINRDGWLFLSPISWYSRTAQWDLSPEYEPENHPRFERPANDRCLQCHAGRLHYAERPTTELSQRYAEPLFHEFIIGCERCHGPGGRHAARHRGESPSKGGTPVSVALSKSDDPTIVNPARLDNARADAVCNQCHLIGASQFLRYGRVHADFRPGDRLSDIWATFVAGTGVEQDRSTRAVSHVEQMHASECFQKSGGKLGCASCHDAHSVPNEAERVAFFDGRCGRCHAADACSLPSAKRTVAPANGSCVACHMPRLLTNDVPHTTQTDHRILRSPQTNEADVPLDPDSPDSWSLFEDRLNPLPKWEHERARGLLLAQVAEQSKDVDLARQAIPRLQTTVTRATDDVDSLDALAVCLILDGQAEAAVAAWERAIAIDPERQSPLYSLGLYWLDRAQPTKANAYFERLIAVNPWPAEWHGRHSVALARLGRLDDAVKSAERARQLNPANSQITRWLADLYRRQGRPDAAQKLEAASE